LYANKEDYKKAGFKMISNEDPTGKKAINHILAGTVLNSVVPLAMTYTGMINPVFLVPFYLYQVKAF
jgi:heme O synthase-like polyprenyltransferase